MDLKQRKLNRSEWNSIEVSVSKDEIDILNMIVKGYHDVNVKINNNNSIFTFLKVEYSEKMEDFIYNKYLRERSDKLEAELKNINLEITQITVQMRQKINFLCKTILVI